MRARWNWLRNDPGLGKALGLLVLVIVGFGVWALLDDGPSLDRRLVDGNSMSSCLEAKDPAAGWQVFTDSQASNGFGLIDVRWSTVGGSAFLMVVPNRSTAEQLDELFGPSGPASPNDLERWGNLVAIHAGEIGGHEPPEPVRAAILDCVDAAATAPVGEADASFEHCGDQPAIPPGGFVYDLRVHGESCAEAVERLTAAYGKADADDGCVRFGEGFGCGIANICCSNNIDFAGDGEIQLAWKTSI